MLSDKLKQKFYLTVCHTLGTKLLAATAQAALAVTCYKVNVQHLL
jgi:hypothetical protein